jgi:hypothetical protein
VVNVVNVVNRCDSQIVRLVAISQARAALGNLPLQSASRPRMREAGGPLAGSTPPSPDPPDGKENKCNFVTRAPGC